MDEAMKKAIIASLLALTALGTAHAAGWVQVSSGGGFKNYVYVSSIKRVGANRFFWLRAVAADGSYFIAKMKYDCAAGTMQWLAREEYDNTGVLTESSADAGPSGVIMPDGGAYAIEKFVCN
jgi:hypothetical protein